MRNRFQRFLMADGGADGGNANPPQPTPPQDGGNKGLDQNELFTKLDEIIEKRTSGLVKSILKEQAGVEGDDLKGLVQSYQANKMNKAKADKDNANKLQDENTKLKEQILEMNFRAKVKGVAGNLEFSSDADKYLDKLINKNDYLNDKNEIDEDKLKKGLEQVLKDFPALKGDASKGLKFVGGKGNGGNDPQPDDALRRAFGLSVKK